MGLIFEWDETKGDINKRKHGISFEEASTAFGDPLSITIEDPFAVLTWNYFTQAETMFEVMPFDIVTAADFWFGNFKEHKAEMETFMRTNIPQLKLLGLEDFKE